jgi:hypothetical protein
MTAADELRAELRDVAAGLVLAVETARAECRRQGIEPHLALDRNGAPILAPLLAARAQVLVALVDLEGRLR